MSTLFVYTHDKLNEFMTEKENFGFYNVFQITSLINSNEYLSVEGGGLSSLGDIIIDVTPLSNINNVNAVLMSEFLVKIQFNHLEIEFCVEETAVNTLLKNYPCFFQDINRDFQSTSNVHKKTSFSLPSAMPRMPLYTYDKKDICNLDKSNVKLISELCTPTENLSFQLNYGSLKNEIAISKEKYLDISSLAYIFESRGDLIIPIQLLLFSFLHKNGKFYF